MKDSLIPFALGADQLHDMAIEKWRSGHTLEALAFMRRALELQPDNLAIRAGLARLLTNAGCLAESMHVLAPGYARITAMDIPQMMLYLSIDTTNNGFLLFSMIQKTQTLRLFLSLPSHAAIKKAVRVLSSQVGGMRYPMQYKNRLDYLRRCLLNGDAEAVHARIAREAPYGRHQLPLYTAIESIAYSMQGRKQSARRAFDALDSEEIQTFYALLSGIRSREYRCEPISQLFSSTTDFVMLASAMQGGEMLPPSLVNRMSHDALILHMMAVTAYNSGTAATEVAEYWQHILTLHPDDTVADHFLAMARADALPPRPMAYAYRLDGDDAAMLKKMALTLCDSVPEALNMAWETLPEFRKALIWLMRADNDAFASVAPRLLDSLSREHRLQLANDYCLAMDLNGTHLYALLCSLHDKDVLDFCRALYTGAKPLSMHRMLSLRCAEEGMDRMIGYSSEPVLHWLMERTSKRRGRNIRGCAAETAYHYLKWIGMDADADKIARALSISPRLARYRMRAAAKEE